jgi:uncharacterized membrane protein
MTGLLAVLIACLIIVLVAAIIIWAIGEVVTLLGAPAQIAQIARIVVILIAVLLIIQRLLPLAGITA